jgi:flagellar basal-body rod protein FlgC
MNFDDMLGAANISASGLSAERLRMEVVANNIANAYSTRTPGGGPFRRQDVVFATVLKDRLRGARGQSNLAGVEAVHVVDDPSDFSRVFNPGHPDADADGYVAMPNVRLPVEMVNLITASRAYEANLKALQLFRQMTEQALTIARSST